MADINLGVGGANSAVAGGYEIDNSLKFEPDNSENLKWTNISSYATSARKKTFSFSAWIKITELGVQRTIWATSANGYLLLQADGQLKWQQSYGGVVKTLNTNRLFRDTSAWYNIIIAVDSTQSTEANRVRLYVNGVEETSLTSTTYPSQNAEAENVYADHHYLGAYTGNQIYWAGYMANVAFISDAQITPSDVGEFDEDTGIWKPKEYSGGSAPSYFLEFKDSSDLGAATGLDADTLTNITSADQATDTPTNNFCTMSPLWAYAYPMTIIEGGTKLTGSQDQWQGAKSTFGVTSGKWYWEVKIGTVSDSGFIGIQTDGESNISSGNSQSQNTTYCRKLDGGDIFFIGGSESTASNGGGNASNNDIIGVALDLDSGTKTIKWFKNNSAYGGTIDLANASTSFTTREVFPFHAMYGSATNNQYNFGGYTSATPSSAASDANGYGTYEYAPPSGYYALCTKNLAEYG